MSTDKLRDAACMRDIPQLVTEGVSEFLTDYQRPGYTEDALRQFVVLDDIEAAKENRRASEDAGEEAEGEVFGEGQGDDDLDDDDDDDMDDGSMSEESLDDEGETSDVPLEEVDMMLEEGLPEDYKIRAEKLPNGKYAKKAQKNTYVNRRLQVIDEIFSNPFDVLPEGWVRVTHNTGIPIYLHKESRVCTTAPPYFLGPGSARKHRLPLSAIPCLQYRKALDKEKADKEQLEKSNAENANQNQENVAEKTVEGRKRRESGNSSESPSKKGKTGERNGDTEGNEKVNEESNKTDDKALDKEKGDKKKENFNANQNVENVEGRTRGERKRSDSDNGSEPPCKKAKTCERNGDAEEDENDKNANGESQKFDDKGGEASIVVKEEAVDVSGDEDCNKAPEKEKTENSVSNCPIVEESSARNDLIERLRETVPGTCPVPPGAPALPKARIETAQENQETQSINHIELREYCQKLFRYRTIDVMRFKTWSERRRFAKVKKKERQLQRPSLPEGTKLITFPILEPGGEDNGAGNRIRKEWIMNPSGKSYVCILHECVQHALKTQPVYEFRDLENPATPYSATVSINKMKYGTGVGTSKRQAKSEAARTTLEVLIPEMRNKMEEDVHRGGAGLSRNQHTDLSFFDDIKIQDPRVHEFCAKTTEPSPYTILLTCLKRNFGMGDMDINCEVKMLRHQKNEFTMTVGNHTATVICKNKREGKQRASQAILQAMHPHITSWGSLLRLYGNRSVKTLREKKQEEQEITTLQSRASANSPNWAILNKLKEAMLKLKERNAAVKPLGTFIPPSNVDLPLASSSNLNNLEL